MKNSKTETHYGRTHAQFLAYYESTVADQVSEQDRKWFESRPHRNYRARPLIEGEFPIPPTADPYRSNITIVKKFSSCMRIRYPLAMYVISPVCGQLGISPMDVPKHEEEIRQLWEQFAEEAVTLVCPALAVSDD